ncbi:recombinase family protein [Nocardia sp. NPDC058058]|uniref:recombinase family protein n=1 Tax=Nocardia sp. NPDC058058 TaxID=3346317 RepID=UPI0036DA8C70
MRKTIVDVPAVYWFLYARVSEEKRHVKLSEGESVPGQLRHLTEMATRPGNVILATIKEDKPISASEYTIKERPGYKKLQRVMASKIQLIRRQNPHAKFVLAAREDTRISRRPVEREELMELCRGLGVCFNFAGAEYDPGNPDHRLVFRVTGATAAHNSDMTSYKVKSKVAQRIADGVPHGKMPRIYKQRFDPETGKAVSWILDPVSSTAVRESVDAILEGRSGVSGHSVAAAADYVEKKTEQEWGRTQFRRMLMNPTLAGLRTVKGDVVGKGVWPALMTEDEHRRLCEILRDPNRKTQRGTKPAHLLSYIPTCGGSCGSTNIYYTGRYGPNHSGRPYYRCVDCNEISVVAEPFEALVVKAMKKLLTHPKLIAKLREPTEEDASEILRLRSEVQTLEARLEDFYAQATAGKISARALGSIEGPLLAEIEGLQAELDAQFSSRRSGAAVLAKYAGAQASELWDTWPLEVRRELIRAGLDIVILHRIPSLASGKGGGKGRRFNPDRIDIQWKVSVA